MCCWRARTAFGGPWSGALRNLDPSGQVISITAVPSPGPSSGRPGVAASSGPLASRPNASVIMARVSSGKAPSWAHTSPFSVAKTRSSSSTNGSTLTSLKDGSWVCCRPTWHGMGALDQGATGTLPRGDPTDWRYSSFPSPSASRRSKPA